MTTSFRICKTDDWKGEVFYKAQCACGNDECSLCLDLEYDDLGYDEEHEGSIKFAEVNLNLETDLNYYEYHNIRDNRFCMIMSRIRTALRVLFTGKIKVSSSFMFRGEKQISEFIKALNEGMEKLEGSVD